MILGAFAVGGPTATSVPRVPDATVGYAVNLSGELFNVLQSTLKSSPISAVIVAAEGGAARIASLVTARFAIISPDTAIWGEQGEGREWAITEVIAHACNQRGLFAPQYKIGGYSGVELLPACPEGARWSLGSGVITWYGLFSPYHSHRSLRWLPVRRLPAEGWAARCVTAVDETAVREEESFLYFTGGEKGWEERKYPPAATTMNARERAALVAAFLTGKASLAALKKHVLECDLSLEDLY